MTERDYLLEYVDGMSADDQATLAVVVSMLSLPTGATLDDVYSFILQRLTRQQTRT